MTMFCFYILYLLRFPILPHSLDVEHFFAISVIKIYGAAPQFDICTPAGSELIVG